MDHFARIWIVVVFLTVLKNAGSETLKASKKNLHHHMTKREVEYLFGVKDHSEIPEYDVATPHETESNGRMMSPFGRRRRSSNTDLLHYKLHAFGSKFRLKLKPNKMLMTPNLVVERHHGGGRVSAHPVPENKFYLGKVSSHPDSLVAVRSDKGLSGMIRTSEDTFFVQPLPAHLAKRVRRSTDRTPHLIYRASSLKLGNSSCQTSNSSVNDPYRGSKHVHDRKRRAASGYKFMEAALVVSQDYVNKYGEKDFATVLLVIANMVAGMFRDSSIGATKVYYVVKKIIRINSTKDELQFKDGDSDVTRLKKLLSWSSTYMNLPNGDSEHFDVFSYITDKVVGGRAVANRMCAPRLPNGNINSDVGLQSALYIAHETGHNAFLGHDVTPECPTGRYIMSGTLPSGIYAATWSNCSSRVLQSFLGGDRSKCLDNSPFDYLEAPRLPLLPPEDQHKLPGEVFDGDKQCRFQYGPGWKKSNYRPGVCSSLYCIKGGVELSRAAPVADGTPCGIRNWCIGGKCEDNGKERIDGGWSPWSNSYTTCTRTCGGGVQHKTRTCTNPPTSNGGNPCEGPKKGHWRICNSAPCPTGTPSFRNQQCSLAWRGSVYHHYGGVCDLYCRIGFSLKPSGRVKDGTICYGSQKNPCIQGICRNAGCDNVVDSNKRDDRCLKCGGNGDSCHHIDKNYTRSYTQAGAANADTIVELPVGTFKVKFQMKTQTRNTLGVQDENGTYLCGGHMGFNQRVKAAGTEIIYTNRRRNFKDSLDIAGPTTALLKVMYIYQQGVNPGVDYTFTRPVQRGEQKPKLTYQWKIDPWSSCSVTCGIGIRTRSMRCQVAEDSTPASDAACGTRPATQKICNKPDCPSSWFTTPWTICSKSCGNGRQTRSVICRKKIDAKNYGLSNNCSLKTKPVVSDTVRSCNKIACAADWETTEGPPDTRCGDEPIDPDSLHCYHVDQSGKRDRVPPLLCRLRAKPTRLPCPLTTTPTSGEGSSSSGVTTSTELTTKRHSQATYVQYSVALTLVLLLLHLT